MKVLAQRGCGQFCHFGIFMDPIGIVTVAWSSLGAKGMGASVRLLVDRLWNGRSDLQAGVEIYYWKHPQILAHFE